MQLITAFQRREVRARQTSQLRDVANRELEPGTGLFYDVGKIVFQGHNVPSFSSLLAHWRVEIFVFYFRRVEAVWALAARSGAPHRAGCEDGRAGQRQDPSTRPATSLRSTPFPKTSTRSGS